MTNGDAGQSAEQSAADKLRSDVLAQEHLVADILKLRKPKEHWWNSSPLLTGLVAIVSIVLSAGASIYTQRAAKTTEFTVAQRSELLAQRRTFLYELAAMLAAVDKT